MMWNHGRVLPGHGGILSKPMPLTRLCMREGSRETVEPDVLGGAGRLTLCRRSFLVESDVSPYRVPRSQAASKVSHDQPLATDFFNSLPVVAVIGTSHVFRRCEVGTRSRWDTLARSTSVDSCPSAMLLRLRIRVVGAQDRIRQGEAER